MKIFRKILNEELIEVNKSQSETIRCLCEQNGVKSPFDGLRIYFYCTPKGKIDVRYRVGYDNRRIKTHVLDVYKVNGKVISDSDKTFVKFTSVYDKTALFLYVLLLTVALVVLPVSLLSRVSFQGLFAPAVTACILTLIAVGIEGVVLYKIKKNGKKLVELIEEELKRRVRNISRWDD